MNEKSVERFKKTFNENIFLCMELSKNSYIEILKMPVLALFNYIEWKIKFDNEREKQRAEALGRVKV